MARAKTTKNSAASVPPVVYAEASPRSRGRPLFANAAPITRETVEQFRSEPEVVAEAVAQLQSEGFEVLHAADTTIT